MPHTLKIIKPLYRSRFQLLCLLDSDIQLKRYPEALTHGKIAFFILPFGKERIFWSHQNAWDSWPMNRKDTWKNVFTVRHNSMCIWLWLIIQHNLSPCPSQPQFPWVLTHLLAWQCHVCYLLTDIFLWLCTYGNQLFGGKKTASPTNKIADNRGLAL